MKNLYEKIIDHLNAYVDSIPNISAKSQVSVDHSKSFLADNYTCRLGDIPLELGRDEMIGMLAEESDQKWTTHVDPFYWIVDEHNYTAAGYFKEELKDSKTGELLRSVNMFTHMELSITDDSIKISKEHIVEAPAKFRVDSL